jgi:Smg protein
VQKTLDARPKQHLHNAAIPARQSHGGLRYIGIMFEVLVYVYENYWEGEACPELERLGRRLTAAGFEAGEIEEALIWLNGLNIAAQGTQIYLSEAGTEANRANPEPAGDTALRSIHTQSASSMRVYSITEQEHLGAEVLGFVSFLETSGVLPSHMREIVIDRAMAAPGSPVTLDDLKIIVLMVYWSFGEEPDALVLDELCDDTEGRIAH